MFLFICHFSVLQGLAVASGIQLCFKKLYIFNLFLCVLYIYSAIRVSVERFCLACDKDSIFFERKTFASCWNHIILQLLRFAESDGEFSKTLEHVLCKELLRFTTEEENGTCSFRTFTLKAIVNHNNTLSNGDYTAIVRYKAEDCWFHCDDHNVTPWGREHWKVQMCTFSFMRTLAWKIVIRRCVLRVTSCTTVVFLLFLFLFVFIMFCFCILSSCRHMCGNAECWRPVTPV